MVEDGHHRWFGLSAAFYGEEAAQQADCLSQLREQFGAPGFPIYRSDDDGHTWHHQSNVPSAGDTTGVWLQPSLYELPRPFAGLLVLRVDSCLLVR
jgi:hypothetical protein